MQEPIQDPRHNALYTIPARKRYVIDWPLIALALLLALVGLVGADEVRMAQVEKQTIHQYR